MVWRPKGETITSGPLADKSFQLAQFHFHTPSENFLAGTSYVPIPILIVQTGSEYPLEVHLVHQADDGTLAVVAVFFQTQDVGHDDFLANLATNLPGVNEEIEEVAPDLKKFVTDSFRVSTYLRTQRI